MILDSNPSQYSSRIVIYLYFGVKMRSIFDPSTVGSIIAGQFQIPCGMMPKSILGVEMVTNRDPNLKYVVQRSYLESTSILYTISFHLPRCVVGSNNDL